jgi:MurNAc alpha-1-phosphate uridylyltransferase
VCPQSGALVLVANPPHHPVGDFGLGADGRVVATPLQFTFAGISVLDGALFAGLSPGRRPLKPVLDGAIERGTLFGQRYDGLWLDVQIVQGLNLLIVIIDHNIPRLQNAVLVIQVTISK